MPTLYEKFQKTPKFVNSKSTLYEPALRLPYALKSPSIVTHIPLFANSQEDRQYASRENQLRDFIDDKEKRGTVPRLFAFDHPPGQTRGTTEELIRQAFFKRSGLETTRVNSSSLRRAIRFVWKTAYAGLRAIAYEKPEFSIFSSYGLISRELNKYVHAEIVGRIAELRQQWADDLIIQNTVHVANATLWQFLSRLTHVSQKFRAAYPSVPLQEESLERQEMLGGVISWLEGAPAPSQDKGPKPRSSSLRVVDLDEEDPKKRTSEKHRELSNYLVWRRGEQNWRYTFYSSYTSYQADPENNYLRQFIKPLLLSAKLEH